MERDELENIEVGVQLDESIPAIKLWVGDNVAFLSPEQALDVAEMLAELAGYIEGMEAGEPVDPLAHPAPDTLQ